MKTLTHIAINYFIAKKIKLPNGSKKYFLLGALAPDLAICFVFMGILITSLSIPDTLNQFRDLYDNSAMVIGLHNALHSPLSLLMLCVLAQLLGARRKPVEMFLVGCFVHSLVDIYTHVNDGPLLMWPFNSTSRFISPLSHWDSNNYGEQVMIFELVLISISVVLFIKTKIQSKDCVVPVQSVGVN